MATWVAAIVAEAYDQVGYKLIRAEGFDELCEKVEREEGLMVPSERCLYALCEHPGSVENLMNFVSWLMKQDRRVPASSPKKKKDRVLMGFRRSRLSRRRPVRGFCPHHCRRCGGEGHNARNCAKLAAARGEHP